MEDSTEKSKSRLISSRTFLESHQWDLDAAADAFADYCADEYADACADAYADACADAACDAYADACTDAACDAYADAWADAVCDAWADAACDAYADACADAACDAYADACADAACDAYADAIADAMADTAFNSLYQTQSSSRYRSPPFPAREPYQHRSLRRPKRKQEEQKTNSAYRTRGSIRTRADSNRTRPGGYYSKRQHYYTGGEKRRGLSTVNNTAYNLHRCRSQPSSSNTRLFVGGLSWSLDEKSLKNALSSFGKIIEVKIIYDRYSGRSRGFGFVHFSKEEDATCAKDAMDGKALSGQPLRISFALRRVLRQPEVIRRLRNTRDFSKRVRKEPIVVPRRRNTRDF